jgi:putative membrane protein
MTTNLKALTLLALGLFLYSRLSTGTIALYINQRFTWLTPLAALGLILVGLSYQRSVRFRQSQTPISDEHTDHEHSVHGESVASAHEHERQHSVHEHEHSPSWVGLLLVAMPVVLGLLVPPKPLGASAMSNREIGLSSLSVSASPNDRVPLVDTGERTILDWLQAFQQNPDPAAFTNQKAQVVGFVYQDGRFGADSFMVSRFVVTHCVADAAAIGLIVRWPDAAELSADQWVEVHGHFEPGEFARQQVAVLVAEAVTPTAIPEHPYLYP